MTAPESIRYLWRQRRSLRHQTYRVFRDDHSEIAARSGLQFSWAGAYFQYVGPGTWALATSMTSLEKSQNVMWLPQRTTSIVAG